MSGQTQPPLPNELITNILLNSIDSYFSKAFYGLILINKGFHDHLFAQQSAKLNSTFKYRPDLLFTLEPYLQPGVLAREGFRELQEAWDEPDDPTLYLDILENVDPKLRSSRGTAHRLVRYAIEHSKIHLARYILRDLGASANQRHLYLYRGGKDLSLANPLWHLDLDRNVEMLRMLVHEFGIDTGVYSGFTTVFQDYVMDDERDLEREVVWLLVEGGAEVIDMVDFQPPSDYLWLWERNHALVLDMFCREERTVLFQGSTYRLPEQGVELFLRSASRNHILNNSQGWATLREVVRRGIWTWEEAIQYANDNGLERIASQMNQMI
ncbi:hypothetical protein BJ742DRAFT_771319 [Cladochytrium replicatum]|nr:hypothetical protein BJ742DRAFT_771319 [Cladochytrium replicatum]